MLRFFDTSVIVAASYSEHLEHQSCVKKLREDGATLTCAAHTLAEVFATLTRLPLKKKIQPVAAFEIVQRLSKRFTVVALNPDEYLTCIRATADRDLAGGIVYDALLLACARKCGASEIYTLNRSHFHKLAPDLSHRILTP